MHVTLKIEESDQGLWCIRRGPALMHDHLRFAAAIRLAHGLARAEHADSGHSVEVQMVCEDFSLTLAEYAIPRAAGHLAA